MRKRGPVIKMLNVSCFEDFKNHLFWEETEKKIGRRRIQKYVVQLIQCICVGRMNDKANEFVHRNLPQNIRQYQSLNVISFDERMVYICQTDYKYFDKEFRRVENLFLKITKDINNDN